MPRGSGHSPSGSEACRVTSLVEQKRGQCEVKRTVTPPHSNPLRPVANGSNGTREECECSAKERPIVQAR
eukprot:974383-Prymnesium_polylepis.1